MNTLLNTIEHFVRISYIKCSMSDQNIHLSDTYMAEFKYEIVGHIVILSESAKGWTRELNKISWNGGEPKYDIRDWALKHEKMGKGVTLSEDEMIKLKELL